MGSFHARGMYAHWSEKLRRDPTDTKFARAYWCAVENQSAGDLINSELSRQFRGESDILHGENQWPTGMVFRLILKSRQPWFFSEMMTPMNEVAK